MSTVRKPIKKTSIQKRDKIIDQGFALMCEKGFHNVSSIDIAKYAGVSTGCIYQYFKDKKAIFVEGAKRHLKNICFPMVDAFIKFASQDISLEEVVSLVLKESVKTQRLSCNAHQELLSMCCLDEEIAQIFSQNELEATAKIDEQLRLKKINLSHSKEKIHLFIHIVDDYSHEMIYHQHPEYDYEVMYEETCKLLVQLLKGEGK